MTIAVTHQKVSAIPDIGDATLVEPSDWNAGHSLSMATGKLLGRATAGAGSVEEIGPTAPLALSAGALSMPVATTSVDGYLSHTDWTTFNGKGAGTVTSVAAITLGTTGTDLTSSVANGTTTPVITLNVPTASASNRGALSSTDWSTFNGKQSTINFGTGVQTALGVNIGSAGAPVLFNGAGGTPSSLTLTNATGLPIAGGGSGQTTANAALNAFLPSQTGNSGKFITTDGSNTSWGTPSGGASVPNGTQTGTSAQAHGLNSIANGTTALAVGVANATGANATSVGAGSLANGANATALGVSATAIGEGAIAVGVSSVATGFGATVMGRSANGVGNSSTAVGYTAFAEDGSTALGYIAKANGVAAVAIGEGSVASATFAGALGTSTVAAFDNSTAVGHDATTPAANSIRLGDSAVTLIGPGSNAACNLATASLCFNNSYFAVLPTITSDARGKQGNEAGDLSSVPLDEAELRVAVRLLSLPAKFKMRMAIAQKGWSRARWHVGVIAQDVVAAFEAEGLNAFEYGVVGEDPLIVESQTRVLKPGGNPKNNNDYMSSTVATDTGESRMSIRYGELQMWMELGRTMTQQ